MKLVIERGELLRALGHVTSVVERRTTIPILSNVLLKASNQGLQFKATDLEREVLEQAPADVSQPGAVTVPEPHAPPGRDQGAGVGVRSDITPVNTTGARHGSPPERGAGDRRIGLHDGGAGVTGIDRAVPRREGDDEHEREPEDGQGEHDAQLPAGGHGLHVKASRSSRTLPRSRHSHL